VKSSKKATKSKTEAQEEVLLLPEMDEDPYSDVRERMESLRQYSATHPPPEHDITWFAAFTTYLGYAVLIAFGRVRDFFGLTLSLGSRYVSPATRKGCAPLLQLRENFYNRRLYHRIQDCFNRPVGGGIGARCRMNVIERVSLDGNKSMVVSRRVADS
jgi:hypothetical protein